MKIISRSYMWFLSGRAVACEIDKKNPMYTVGCSDRLLSITS